MAKESKAWFFVVDAGRGRLLQCSVTPTGRLHVEERSTIENPGGEHEHGRPSPLSGKSGNSYASTGHEGDDRLRRFAKQVAEWLEKEVGDIRAPHVTLFSPPRFLGELRKSIHPGLSGRIREHQGDLTQLSTAGLAKHPAIGELVSGHTA